MKGRRSSLKPNERLTNRETGDGAGENLIWTDSLKAIANILQQAGKMFSVSLQVCFIVLTFNYGLSGLMFIEFSIWSSFLLTLDAI